MASTFDRRRFLSRSAMAGVGLALAGGAPGLLAGCGNDDEETSTASEGGSASFGTLDYQLSWIKNVEFAGQYIADSKGYYKAEGFESVNLLAGGPNVQQDAVVAAGKAFVGISSPDITAAAILKGAPLVAVGALFQKNPFAVLSLAENPIAGPEDMLGKKIGVQAVNEPVWNAFLKANEIDAADIDKVVVQFDPQPLVAKEVDGWFSFFTNEPNLLRTQGVEVETFLLNDHNYPLVSQIYVVQKESVTKDRDKIKALFKADMKGWNESVKDPAIGPDLVVTKYGKDLKLDEAEQLLESKDQNTLIVTSDTEANGIGTVTPEIVEESIATLALAGVKISAEDLFDLSIIDEVYEENPDLKSVG